MRVRKTIPLVLVLLGLLLGTSGAGQGTDVFDPGADFSSQTNPNGVWEYGYSAKPTLDADQFRLDKGANGSDPIYFWHAGPGQYYPYVACNTSGATQADPTKSWAVRAGEMAMEAANDGCYSIVRFTAPRAGQYKVRADFEGIHFRISTTDVHVLRNGQSLFDAQIAGYGGDDKFHKIQGEHPTASYSGSVELKAGDRLSFAVGYGANKTHFNDTTGLMLHIELAK